MLTSIYWKKYGLVMPLAKAGTHLYIMKISGVFLTEPLYKVGVSNDPQKRMKALESSMPFATISLIRQFSDMGKSERQIHGQMKEHNVGDEFFKTNMLLKSLISGKINILDIVTHELEETKKEERKMTPEEVRGYQIARMMFDRDVSFNALVEKSGVGANTLDGIIDGKGECCNDPKIIAKIVKGLKTTKKTLWQYS